MATQSPKALYWVGSALDDLKSMPGEVQRALGYGLFLALLFLALGGEKHPDAKPLKGFGGARVLEIVDRYDSDTYRVVYTVQFEGAVYCLHAFQKKSKRGIRTPQREIQKVRQRLRDAQQHHESLKGEGR